ncbi:MAG: NAD(P)-dependent oxidoreductase [Desulfobacterales bacterium]|nr:NAD(P)-dependent oxidoreductase [Desulfobacterales bacterium]
MILVTGARGFLGRYCLRELSRLDEPLFLTTGNKNACGKDGNLTFNYLNLEEKDSFNNLPDRIDTVIHLAALIPKKNETISFSRFMDVNACGVERLLKAVSKRGCKRFIYASTQMVVEKAFYLPVDEAHPLVPTTDYGITKAIGEKYCLSLQEALNLDVISLRFVGIFGAGENPGFVLTNFIEKATKGLPLLVHGSGKEEKDLLYVKDAAQAVIKALNSRAIGVFNIGSGRGTSIKELAETISEVFGEGISMVEFSPAITDSCSSFYMDIGKARHELGFAPQYSLKDGLADYKRELEK